LMDRLPRTSGAITRQLVWMPMIGSRYTDWHGIQRFRHSAGAKSYTSASSSVTLPKWHRACSEKRTAPRLWLGSRNFWVAD